MERSGLQTYTPLLVELIAPLLICIHRNWQKTHLVPQQIVEQNSQLLIMIYWFADQQGEQPEENKWCIASLRAAPEDVLKTNYTDTLIVLCMLTCTSASVCNNKNHGLSTCYSLLLVLSVQCELML